MMNKQNGIGLIGMVIIAGIVLGLAATFIVTTDEDVVAPEITDVEGLTTTSAEVDDTDPDEIDNHLIKLEQEFSAF